jgi:16S rRNA (guanine(966)-N(2))-methyltransferase RsmD
MKLASPKSDVSRPILDRVKESLFSVLYKYDLLEGRRVADVFSGVGSLGLEALSRGASWVTFVERDPQIAALLQQNIEKAGFAGQSKVLRSNAFKIGAPVDFEQDKYGIIFIDPPYPLTRDVSGPSQLGKMMEILPDQLADDGIVVVRTQKRVELMGIYGQLKVIDRRVWGSMNIAILRKESYDE